MSLEHILQSLEEEAERQINEIEEDTDATVTEIAATAEEQVAAERQKQIDTVQETLGAERTRIVNQAKLEATQIVLHKREALMAMILDAAAQQLSAVSASGAYPQLLQSLTQEAVGALEAQGGLHFQVRSCDVELMAQMVQALNIEATIAGDLDRAALSSTSLRDHLGGLVASTEDGRIQLTNTLDARLARVAEIHRSQIAEMLFGEEGR